MGRFMPATGFATLWNFQLQLYGFLLCNFCHFYLATNIKLIMRLKKTT